MILSGELLIGDPAHPVEPQACQVYLQVRVHSQHAGQASCALYIHMDGHSAYTIRKRA